MSNANESLILTVPQMFLQSGMTCWAAALASWFTVHPSSPLAWRTPTEASLVKEMRAWNTLHAGVYKKKEPLLHANDALTKAGIAWLFENAGMAGKAFPLARTITYPYLYQMLRQRKQLLVVRIWSGGMSHALVLYGIQDWSKPACQLWVMDPNRGHQVIPAQELKEDKQLFVCWLA